MALSNYPNLPYSSSTHSRIANAMTKPYPMADARRRKKKGRQQKRHHTSGN